MLCTNVKFKFRMDISRIFLFCTYSFTCNYLLNSQLDLYLLVKFTIRLNNNKYYYITIILRAMVNPNRNPNEAAIPYHSMGTLQNCKGLYHREWGTNPRLNSLGIWTRDLRLTVKCLITFRPISDTSIYTHFLLYCGIFYSKSI